MVSWRGSEEVTYMTLEQVTKICNKDKYKGLKPQFRTGVKSHGYGETPIVEVHFYDE